MLLDESHVSKMLASCVSLSDPEIQLCIVSLPLHRFYFAEYFDE